MALRRFSDVTWGMRFSWIAILVACSSIALADPKPAPVPAPDLVFTWKEGELSRDMSIWTTTITVTGSKLHYQMSYVGRNGGMPNSKPLEVDGAVKNPKKLAAAIVALDKIKVKPAKKEVDPTRYQYRSGCIQRGKAERCASASGRDPDPDDLKAIAAIRDELLTGVNLAP